MTELPNYNVLFLILCQVQFVFHLVRKVAEVFWFPHLSPKQTKIKQMEGFGS